MFLLLCLLTRLLLWRMVDRTQILGARREEAPRRPFSLPRCTRVTHKDLLPTGLRLEPLRSMLDHLRLVLRHHSRTEWILRHPLRIQITEWEVAAPLLLPSSR